MLSCKSTSSQETDWPLSESKERLKEAKGKREGRPTDEAQETKWTRALIWEKDNFFIRTNSLKW